MTTKQRIEVMAAGVLLALVLASGRPSAQFQTWFMSEVAKWIVQGKEFASVAKVDAMADELAGIKGDYDPAHYPLLTSGCAADDECSACLSQHAPLLTSEFFVAENNFVLYLRTMKKYEMMVSLADAATSLPTEFARYAWLIQKGSPRSGMNVARKQFVAHYGEAQKKHLETINQALLGIAQCEVPYDEGWYNRVGMPFYTQLLMRWTSVK